MIRKACFFHVLPWLAWMLLPGALGCGPADPTTDDDCTSPPANFCQDDRHAVEYPIVGEPRDGRCVYDPHVLTCVDGCVDGACACAPRWAPTGPCGCEASACAGCSGTRPEEDGCGNRREAGCTVEPMGCAGSCCGEACCAPEDECVEGRCAVTGVNPVLDGDLPDPHVLRVETAPGQVDYFLTHTTHHGGDIPIWRSTDLVRWEAAGHAFGRASTPGDSLEINGAYYCSIWAPQIIQLGLNSFLLSFSATRFLTPQTPCPDYVEDGGVYLAWSSAPTGPFAPIDHPWEPLAAGPHHTCDAIVADGLPRSLPEASRNCQGDFCHQVIRLDSDVFFDDVTGRWWLTYSWFTNLPPTSAWEQDHNGEHTGVVELDPADPFTVPCDGGVPQIHIADPQDAALITRLAGACARCGEMLSFTRGRFGEEVVRDGWSWGVAEGGSLFRRGDHVYLLASGSLWDSPYYHVFWTAATSVEALSVSNPDRLAGRFLIPSRDQAFGHGTPVLGPDGETWYYVHHRLDAASCAASGDCARDVFVTPILFEDHGDGRGDVHIAPAFPAESDRVVIYR